MGKVAVAQTPHDVPGSSSREVFQGLFKDLGKQAMALEAILRTVCGRVDKMENWLTEMSFGMTELDLKLRNIAHNIDGTTAVDDEALGPHRWAMPESGDVKPVAHTVSKKLGGDKKAVRVTGMAAAILDQLATTSGTTPAVAEYEKVEKPSSAKKKSKDKDKKHGVKKVKPSGLPEVPVISSPAIVDTVPPPAIPLPASVVEAKQLPILEVEPVVESVVAPIEEEEMPSSEKEPPARKEEEQVVLSPPPPMIVETPTPFEEVVEKKVDAPVEVEPVVMTNEPEHVLPESDRMGEENAMDVFDSAPANDPAVNLSNKSSPIPTPRGVINNDGPHETPPEIEQEAEAEMMEEAKESVSVPQSAAMLTEPQPVEAVPTTNAEPTASSVKPLAVIPRTVQTPSVSRMLPTVQVEREVEPFVQTTTAQMSPTTVEPSNPPAKPVPTPVILNDTKVVASTESVPELPTFHHASIAVSSPPPESKPVVVPEPAPVVPEVLKTVEAPINANGTHQQGKTLSFHASQAAGPTADPLMSNRLARRRSSKRPSLSKKVDYASAFDAARRLSNNKRGSHSRQSSFSATQAPVPEQPTSEYHQQLQPSSPMVQSEPNEIPSPVSTAVQSDISENSDESENESSSDGSSSSGSDEAKDEDAEAGAAVEEISKTMIALKKLKKAHMLSPEEETELKDRAHKKWFQLRGHIKEKQKKDVTNILLKRKKNVFTVSSRIELLEEKSRELFAALKQFAHDMRDKNDRVAHETLRRRVADIEQNLQSVDSRIASLSMPAMPDMEKVDHLESEVISLRDAIQLQLITAQNEATARHSLLEEALASQRTLIETLTQDFPTQINDQTELFLEKLKQQPDYNAAIENLRKSLRRKADLKLLKELEARLLGLDAENEDCLVRCLSCHKEVTSLHNEKDTDGDDQDVGNTSQLRKVNPGPSSARIYRSNVPFSASVQESIVEESSDDSFFPRHQPLLAMPDPQPYQQLQSAGDSYANEKPPVVRVPSAKWLGEPSRKREVKSAPLSLMHITATRAIFSPDRPISAPVVPMKKKSTTATKSKSVLKSLTPQLELPQ